MAFVWLAVIGVSILGLAVRLLWRKGAPWNSALIFAGLAITFGYAVLYQPLYTELDSLLPWENFPDLIAKLALFLAFGILGVKLAEALGDRRAKRWIGGVPGLLIALALYCVVLASFSMSRTNHPSPLLEDFQSQPAVVVYTAATLLYASYVACWLLLPLGRSLRRAQPLVKISRLSIMLGLVCVVVRFVFVFVGLEVPAVFDTGQVVASIGAVLVVAGLGLAAVVVRNRSTLRGPVFIESDA